MSPQRMGFVTFLESQILLKIWSNDMDPLFRKDTHTHVTLCHTISKDLCIP